MWWPHARALPGSPHALTSVGRVSPLTSMVRGVDLTHGSPRPCHPAALLLHYFEKKWNNAIRYSTWVE